MFYGVLWIRSFDTIALQGFKIGEPLFAQIDSLGILIYERGNTGLIYHEKIQLQGLS